MDLLEPCDEFRPGHHDLAIMSGRVWLHMIRAEAVVISRTRASLPYRLALIRELEHPTQ